MALQEMSEDREKISKENVRTTQMSLDNDTGRSKRLCSINEQ